jgi:hypothetical protein
MRAKAKYSGSMSRSCCAVPPHLPAVVSRSLLAPLWLSLTRAVSVVLPPSFLRETSTSTCAARERLLPEVADSEAVMRPTQASSRSCSATA